MFATGTKIIKTKDLVNYELVGHAFSKSPSIMLTEFGGIDYKKDSNEGWGYTAVGSDKKFIEDYKRVIYAI